MTTQDEKKLTRLADIARRNGGEPSLVVYIDRTWDILGSRDVEYEEGVFVSLPLADIRNLEQALQP